MLIAVITKAMTVSILFTLFKESSLPPFLLVYALLLVSCSFHFSTPAAVTVRSTIARLRKGQQETG